MAEAVSDHTAEILAEVAEERARHDELGWTQAHDDQHNVDHLVNLGLKYAKKDDANNEGYYSRDNLVKATSLLVAAIERLDRT